jgi:outer membrane protein assembly factor BamA
MVAAISAGVTAAELPAADELEASGAVIGEIIYDKANVFDTSRPDENNWLYRLANRLHVVTRDSVLRDQLLFRPGDAFDERLLEESERLLRQNAFLYDASVEPVRYEDGVVDVRVKTRDLWTLMPGVSAGRSGGANHSGVSLSERNLLGHGVALSLAYSNDVDRESTRFAYYDKNLGRSWTSLYFQVADNSDGATNDFRLIRPFYALDSRWSAGFTVFDDAREVSFYELGNEAAEYSVDTQRHNFFVGWSRGLQNGWVRRWTGGFIYDERRFSTVPDNALPDVVPMDRKFAYPYLGFEILEDRFQSTTNRDQIDRTEDFNLGRRFAGSIGYATEGFGADRDAILYRLEASRGFGSIRSKALLLGATLDGRLESGDSVDTSLELTAHYYNQITDKRLFVLTLDGVLGWNPDLDRYRDLGGDTGLRGYPLRYQTGDSKILMTMEQRYYTNWYPFRLARIGGAIFADVGRVWGDSPLGSRPAGWLKDIGLGLRLVPTRASGRDVIHIDVAFPLDGDPSIDNVQFLVETKKSF